MNHGSFILRLVEPVKSGFAGVSVRQTSQKKLNSIGNGTSTIRFKATGSAVLQVLETFSVPDDCP